MPKTVMGHLKSHYLLSWGFRSICKSICFYKKSINNRVSCFCCIVLHFDRIPLYGVLILSFGSGILAAVIVHLFVSPYLKKKILREVYGDERERTLSAASERGVSFTKSPTVTEPQEGKQDTSGRFYQFNSFTFK